MPPHEATPAALVSAFMAWNAPTAFMAIMASVVLLLERDVEPAFLERGVSLQSSCPAPTLLLLLLLQRRQLMVLQVVD